MFSYPLQNICFHVYLSYAALKVVGTNSNVERDDKDNIRVLEQRQQMIE